MARRNGRNGSTPAATYTFSLQAQYPNRPGMLAQIAAAVGDRGGNIGDIDVVKSSGNTIVREISVSARDSDHAREIVEHVKKVKGVTHQERRGPRLPQPPGRQDRDPQQGARDVAAATSRSSTRPASRASASPSTRTLKRRTR